MRFEHQVITSLEDVTANFEQLEGKAILDSLPTNFLQLLFAQELKIDSGTANLVFTASASSAVLTVNHGLGAVPQRVWAGLGFQGGLFAAQLTISPTNPTTTQLSLQGQCSIVLTQNLGIQWFVIG